MRRSFKDYCQQWEDAAANSVGAGGVSMPSDMMTKASRSDSFHRFTHPMMNRVPSNVVKTVILSTVI